MKPAVQVEVLQERIKSLREAVDRADALASAQAQTIAAYEGALAVYGKRIDELQRQLKTFAEAV